MGRYDNDRGRRLRLWMKSGKFELRKRAPTRMFREVQEGNRMMPAPVILSGTFQGAIATYNVPIPARAASPAQSTVWSVRMRESEISEEKRKDENMD